MAVDGGAILTDEGMAICTGDVSRLFPWAARACDAGVVENIRVIEMRPSSTEVSAVAIEVYGTTTSRCVVPRPTALVTALVALVCTPVEPARGSALAL